MGLCNSLRQFYREDQRCEPRFCDKLRSAAMMRMWLLISARFLKPMEIEQVYGI